jgi:hypothetical protein
MDALLALIPLAQEKSIDQEGRDIILSMLVVGLIFLSVIGLGQLSRWASHRRRRNRRPAR